MQDKETPLYVYLQSIANELKKQNPHTREQALTITKLEEASMWAERMHYTNPAKYSKSSKVTKIPEV